MDFLSRSCAPFDLRIAYNFLTQVEKESTEPTLVHSDKVKVKHGLIVIADDEDPEGLKASYRRQGLRKSLSLSDKLLRFEEIKN